jgi:hypothetical protein
VRLLSLSLLLVRSLLTDSLYSENQRALLNNALAVANRVPTTQSLGGGAAIEETAWKNCWNWNLPDAAFGALVLDIREGRVGSELKSQGASSFSPLSAIL